MFCVAHVIVLSVMAHDSWVLRTAQVCKLAVRAAEPGEGDMEGWGRELYRWLGVRSKCVIS